MKKNRLTYVGLVGLILIIASILVVVIGLYFEERLIMFVGWALFTFSIFFLAILPVIIIYKNKSQNDQANTGFKPIKHCKYCGHSLLEDAKKCHICGKTIQ